MKLIRLSIISLFLFLFVLPALAEIKTFIREYTYQASEADSKLSSRSISLREVKRLLLEELGTYLESISEIQNFQLTKDQIFTLTAGIVQTEIVDEKWDGRSYWLKARIAADSDEIIKNIDALRRDFAKTKELEQVRKRSDEQLREIARLRKELVTTRDETRAKEKAAYDDAISRLTAIEWFEKGYAFCTSGDYRNAINAYTKSIEFNPKYASTYNNRGYAHDKLGNHKQAIKDYNKAIVLDSVDAVAYNNRGCAYIELGNYRKAIKDFNKAIELNPNYAVAYNNRGCAYFDLGNHRQFYKDIKTAARLGYKVAQDALRKVGKDW